METLMQSELSSISFGPFISVVHMYPTVIHVVSFFALIGEKKMCGLCSCEIQNTQPDAKKHQNNVGILSQAKKQVSIIEIERWITMNPGKIALTCLADNYDQMKMVQEECLWVNSATEP